MTNCDDSLRDRVAGRIACAGPVSFADFMEMALYEPSLGYYVSGKEKWGKGGDYITTLDLSPVFARIMARQLLEMWQVLGSPGRFHIVEAGAGRGWLTKEILRAIRGLDTAMADALHVHLVEKNPGFRSEWEGWKEEGLCFSELNWHADISDIQGPVAGCIYSNELFDAMPFHRLVMRGGKLREIYTGLNAGGDGFKDIEGELSTPALSGYFEGLGLELGDGQRAEVNLNLSGWIEAASDLLSEGFVITVDYGMPAWRLYEKGRSGTLMCHYRHTLNDDPYRNLGRQDITAHLDFTSLMNAGAGVGFDALGYTTQRCFMMGLGVAEDLIELSEDSSKDSSEESEAICYNQGIKELIMPGGIGDTMKVMVQYKPRAPAPAQSSQALISLKGFSFKDMTRTLK